MRAPWRRTPPAPRRAAPASSTTVDVAVFRRPPAPPPWSATTSLPSSQCTNCSRTSVERGESDCVQGRPWPGRRACPGRSTPRSSRRVARGTAAPERASKSLRGVGPFVAVEPGDVCGSGPAVLATVHTLTVSSQIASSVPSATGIAVVEQGPPGVPPPLPSRRLLTGLCTTVDPASAIRVRGSASSTQTAWITLVCGLEKTCGRR